MFKKIIIGGLLIASQFCIAQNKYEEDFLKFWNDYNEYYAYFEKKGIDWNKVKDIYLPLIKNVKDNYEFTALLERVTHELHNGHVSLNTNLNTSNRIIPSGRCVCREKRKPIFYNRCSQRQQGRIEWFKTGDGCGRI